MDLRRRLRSGTGVTASRTYTSTGNKTVTLTVSDGTTTAQTTRTATPSAATAAATLSHVASASSAGNRVQPHGADPRHRAGRGHPAGAVHGHQLTQRHPGQPDRLDRAPEQERHRHPRPRLDQDAPQPAMRTPLLTVTSSDHHQGHDERRCLPQHRHRPVGDRLRPDGRDHGHHHPHLALRSRSPKAGSWLVNSWTEKSSTTQTWTKPTNATTRAQPGRNRHRQGQLPDRRLQRPRRHRHRRRTRGPHQPPPAAAPSSSPSSSAPGNRHGDQPGAGRLLHLRLLPDEVQLRRRPPPPTPTTTRSPTAGTSVTVRPAPAPPPHAPTPRPATRPSP